MDITIVVPDEAVKEMAAAVRGQLTEEEQESRLRPEAVITLAASHWLKSQTVAASVTLIDERAKGAAAAIRAKANVDEAAARESRQSAEEAERERIEATLKGL